MSTGQPAATGALVPLDTVLAAVLDAALVADADGRVVLANAAAGALLGTEPAALAGAGLDDLLGGAAVGDALRTAVETRGAAGPVDAVVAHGAARGLAVSVACTAFGTDGAVLALVVLRDTTESRRASAEVREREAKLRLVTGQLPALVWTTDTELVVTSALGSPLDAVRAASGGAFDVGRSILELVTPEFTVIEEGHRRVLAGESVSMVVDWGGREWEIRNEPLRDDAGAIVGCLGLAVDVTDVRAADAALREGERQLALVFNGVSDLIWVVRVEEDSTLRFVGVNEACHHVLGPEAQDVVGRKLEDVLGPRRAARLLSRYEEAIAGRRPVTFDERRPGPGGEILLETRLTAIYDEQGACTHVLGIARDATAERALERRLRQARTMEAVGHLASAVAHDFNNLLTVIRAHAEFLRARTGDEAALGEGEQILHVTERAGELTRQLLELGRDSDARAAAVDLNALVATLRAQLERIACEPVELVLDLDPEAPAALADPAQLERVVLNLVVNARDAMPAGGTLRIATGEAVAARDGAVAPRGRHATLVVADTGTGMDEATRERVFEPYFTTKPNGSGLGLATVYAIVSRAGGDVRVESVPGAGTEVILFLPVAGDEASDAGAPEPEEPPCVLVLEDEGIVLDLVRRVLELQGYAVVVARTPAEAGAALADGRRVDLLLTDVVMPEARGTDVAESLRERHPGLRVLFMSGYAEADDLGAGGAGPLLEKPFGPAELLAAVEAALAT